MLQTCIQSNFSLNHQTKVGCSSYLTHFQLLSSKRQSFFDTLSSIKSSCYAESKLPHEPAGFRNQTATDQDTCACHHRHFQSSRPFHSGQQCQYIKIWSRHMGQSPQAPLNHQRPRWPNIKIQLKFTWPHFQMLPKGSFLGHRCSRCWELVLAMEMEPETALEPEMEPEKESHQSHLLVGVEVSVWVFPSFVPIGEDS